MIVYNGGSISNLVRNIGKDEIFVTDTFARAVRYANAQATGVVRPDYDLPLAEGAAILFIETDKPNWMHREEDHSSLDVCEAFIRFPRIVKVVINPSSYENTLYGDRRKGYKRLSEIIEMLEARGIKVDLATRKGAAQKMTEKRRTARRC